MSDTENPTIAARALTFTSNFPIPSPMNVKGDPVNNWEFFRQQWTDYEVATGLDKQEQKIRLATFRSIMGKECLQIFLNLKLSDEERNDINECVKALESYFKPKRNVVYERYQFNLCTQNPEEPVDSYINRLRKAASTCQFGTLTEELIRDRLVIGLQDHSTKLRLLKEESLDLNKALNICRSSEVASQQLKAMKLDDKKSPEEVRVVRERQQNRNKSRNPRNAPMKPTNSTRDHNKRQDQAPKRKPWQCFHCGGKQRHSLEKCPAFGHECKACKKPNHFASVCRSASRSQVKQIAEEIDTDDEQETDSDEFFYKVEEVSSVQAKGKQLFASLEFSDAKGRYRTKLECQLDTGATCNVLTHRDLSIISQNGNPALQTSKVKLRLFNGSVMKPLGEVKLKVLKEDKQHELKFQVVEGDSKPLLSAETCETLGLLKINCEPTAQVNTIQGTTSQLTKEKILADFKDVFEGLGHIGKASLTVDPDVTPVHHAPRRIAVTLHQEVKAKLEELERKNILVKETEPTDWISSMVVVAKPGKIRICLDPKDLNEAVKRPKYQMPTLEEVLPKLSKAKVFTTLDAKDGFYQISLDEASSKLTTFWTPFGRYRYLRMPFGISAAPEEFECKLHEHLSDLEGVAVLRDDILVIGSGDTLKEATEQDPVMQTLKSTILVGWPDTREQVPISIREYWNFKEDLTLHNGILFKSQRIIIPRALRPEMISRLHSSHLGIEACLRKARDRVYWPAMNSDIKEAVTKCEVCAEYQASNPQQPLQTHKIPDRPWSRLAADMFTLRTKNYIVLVDYYSDFVEVSPLKEITASAIIKFMKVQFSRHGIPDVLVSDNGPQFANREFAEFAKNWEFQHVTSSPYHPKSNGKAESAVKVVKRLFKKALKDNKDPWLSLLDYRNTPTAGIQSSPVQRLMSRRTKTLVPIATNLLYPNVPEGVTDKIQLKRQKAKSYHDRNVKILPDLDIGQEVRIAPLHRGKSWEVGTCLQKLSDRSYLVETKGEVLRRNRQAIKPVPEVPAVTEEPKQTAVSPPTDSVSSTAVPVLSPPALRSSSRAVKRPVRFQDYVC